MTPTTYEFSVCVCVGVFVQNGAVAHRLAVKSFNEGGNEQGKHKQGHAWQIHQRNVGHARKHGHSPHCTVCTCFSHHVLKHVHTHAREEPE